MIFSIFWSTAALNTYVCALVWQKRRVTMLHIFLYVIYGCIWFQTTTQSRILIKVNSSSKCILLFNAST